MENDRNRLKNAELLSLIGACIASGGAALWLLAWLEPLKLPLLLGGLVLHAAAMFYRNRMERVAGKALTRWEKWLYWFCWLALAMLALYVLAAGVSNGATDPATTTGVQNQALSAGFAVRVELGPLLAR